MPDGLVLSSMLSLQTTRATGLLATHLVDLAAVAPVDVPIAQSQAPVTGPEGLRDTALLTSADGSTTYYLPRYRLRRAGDVYDVRVEDGGDGRWWFRVVLDLVPADELGDAARTATVLPGPLSARLTFGHPVAQTVGATEQGEVAGGISLGIALSLEERDALLWALKSEQGASLVVVRSVRVAVPSGEAAPFFPWIIAMPQIVVPVVEPPVDPVPEPVPPDPVLPDVTLPIRILPQLLDTRLAAGLASDTTASLVADVSAVADVARVAEVRDHRTTAVVRDHRADPDTWVPRRGDIAEHVVVRDHRVPRWRPRRPVEPVEPVEPVPGDQRTVRYVDATPEFTVPLRFDPTVHPYVYPGAATGRPTTFERVVVPDPAGRSHTYLRNPAVPHVFSYLPDAFRLARTTTPPLRPALAFAVSDDGATVTLTAQVVPAVDTARLTAAAEALAAHVPERDGVRAPVDLRPVQAPARVMLGLLDTGVGDGDDDPVDLVNGFLLAEAFAFERFQDVYAALAATGDVSAVLRGQVAVDTGLPSPDLVPIELRFASAVGDVLASSVTTTPESGVQVTLRNASESPVRLLDAPVELWAEGAPVPATGTGPDLPHDLAAGADATFTLTPAAVTPDAVPRLRPGTVQPQPDPAAILEHALDKRVDGSVDGEVTVLTTAAKLTGDGSRPVETVVVELRGGDTVTVDAATPKVTATIPVPLVDLLLGRDLGPYQYRQTLVTTAGETVQDADWRTETRPLLVVPVTP